MAGSTLSNGQLKWSYPTGSYVGFSSPAVANGVVYVGGLGAYPTPGNLYALYANNGTKLWSDATGSFVDSSSAVSNGVVEPKKAEISTDA